MLSAVPLLCRTLFEAPNSKLAAILCGNLTASPPGPYVLGPNALLQFVTDSAAGAEGFFAAYEAFYPTTCEASTAVTTSSGPFGVFNATAGRDTALPMPYYPGYQRGATCAWQVSFDRPVSMPPSQTAWFAGVNYTMLDISCASSDRVRVYVGTVAAPDALLWSSCSSTDPTPLLWLGVDAA